MPVNVLMPKLGMTMKEGKVVKWHCKEGQEVEEGDIVAEIETEKITYQIEAPISGILVKILIGEGNVAPVGQPIGIMIKEGETFDESAMIVPPPEVSVGIAPSETRIEVSSPPSDQTEIRITPIARKIAKEKGLDINKIKGTGPGGRITREDVLAFAEAPKEVKAPEKEPVREGVVGLGATMQMTRMREIIGERLTTSSRDVPHVYFACEVDGSGMVGFRNKFMEIVESTVGVRLSFNDILLKAVATAIEKYPLFNAMIEGKTVKIHKEINIGLAVSIEEGLIVPVIRRVNEKALRQIALDRENILNRAKTKKLTLDDLTGGTFTVSNLGQFNIDFFTSIINSPETAILSVAKMKERPVVVDGAVAIRPTLNLGLSADHRVVDGAMAAGFLQELQKILEDPYLMCLV